MKLPPAPILIPPPPAPAPVQPAAATAQPAFDCNEMGYVLPTPNNVIIAINTIGVKIRFDLFSREELIEGLREDFGPRLDDAAIRHMHLKFETDFGLVVKKDKFYDVVSDHARTCRFHPVRDYLNALPPWDGVPRIDTWLIDAGAEDTPYTRAVSRLPLIAAVRRIRHPGCKFDEMLVLEGEQGTEKSTALRTLTPNPAWFTDDLHLNGDSKALMETTAGKWIIEAGEMKGLSKSDQSALKGWLSRREDNARMSYDRKSTTAPRQFIVIGTTNMTEGYLKDPTGDRRFWPVRIQRFNVANLDRDRDQIWAEAAAAEAAGEDIRLDKSLWAAAAIEQEARAPVDPVELLLAEQLEDQTGTITTVDAMRILGIDAKASQDQLTRMGFAMGKLGWCRTRRRIDGKQTYIYVRGSAEEQRFRIVVTVRRSDLGDRSVNVTRAAPGYRAPEDAGTSTPEPHATSPNHEPWPAILV